MNPLQRVVAVVGLLGLLGLAAWLNSTIRHTPAPPPNTTQRAISLDTARQKDIWRAEHTTFEIEQRFGPAFLEFVNSRSVERLAAFTSPTFRGQGLGSAQALERRHGDIIETIRTRAERTNNPLTAQQLADALLKLHSVFAVTPRASLRVLEIKEATPQGDAWTARLLITSTGTTESGQRRQVLSEHTINGTITDGTRLGEVPWITNWTIQRTVQRNGPPGLFQEVTAEWGLDKLPIPDNWKLAPGDFLQNRFQMAVADFNRDGRLDVAVAAIDVPPLLLAGDTRQGFRGVAAEVGLVTGSSRDHLTNFAVGWIDFDNDGWPDLILGDKLYHNRNGRKFVDVTGASGLGFLPECMGCLIADYDADGRLDIYILYQKRLGQRPTGREQWIDETGSGLSNQLWRNRGGGQFENVTAAAGAGGGKRHTHAAAWFSLDKDRFPDLFLANDFGKNVILRNRGDGSFEDVSSSTGANGFSTSMGVAAGDLNNDGQCDIYVANMYSKMGRRIIGLVQDSDYPEGVYQQIRGSCAGNRLYCGRGHGQFEEVSGTAGVNSVGWAYGPVLADFDADGQLDIYSTTGFLSFDRKKPDG